jgi:putative transposase
MKYRLIGAEKAQHPVSLLCEVLGVSRSGFHAWLKRHPPKRWVDDARLAELIHQIHEESDGTYGSPRIHAELRARGVRVGKKRVERLMRRHSLSGLPKRRGKGKTTIRVPGVRPAPDLVGRDFMPVKPNRLWVADLTEVQTWEGKLYLAVVLDCFSRRVVGWSMRDDMRAELVVEAFEMAVSGRKPEAGLVHHSDQGSQYVSLRFGERCREAGIRISMGAPASALDNAACEAFFASLKRERLNRRSWPTKREARSAIFEWIESWYNPRRLHSTLGYLSPNNYEQLELEKEEIKEEAA